jgi:hypothetical protein
VKLYKKNPTCPVYSSTVGSPLKGLGGIANFITYLCNCLESKGEHYDLWGYAAMAAYQAIFRFYSHTMYMWNFHSHIISLLPSNSMATHSNAQAFPYVRVSFLKF